MGEKDEIKLGKIVDGKVEGMSESCVWDLDYTLAIIIRDYLRKLADNPCGAPTCYDDNWDLIEDYNVFNNSNDNIDEQCEKWSNHLREIADKFDYYTKNEHELLDEEDNIFLNHYYDTYPLGFKDIGNGLSQLTREVSNNRMEKYIEDQKKYDSILSKISEISENKVKIVREAFEDLKKIYSNIWS